MNCESSPPKHNTIFLIVRDITILSCTTLCILIILAYIWSHTPIYEFVDGQLLMTLPEQTKEQISRHLNGTMPYTEISIITFYFGIFLKIVAGIIVFAVLYEIVAVILRAHYYIAKHLIDRRLKQNDTYFQQAANNK